MKKVMIVVAVCLLAGCASFNEWLNTPTQQPEVIQLAGSGHHGPSESEYLARQKELKEDIERAKTAAPAKPQGYPVATSGVCAGIKYCVVRAIGAGWDANGVYHKAHDKAMVFKSAAEMDAYFDDSDKHQACFKRSREEVKRDIWNLV